MKKLQLKTENFFGKSVFFRPDGTFSILEVQELPEGFVFGVEASETGVVVSSLGSFYIKVTASDDGGIEIEVLPWSTFTGLLGDYSYTSGSFLENTSTHKLVALTDGESEGAHLNGASLYNFGAFPTGFDDGNQEYARSFVEVGDYLIIPNQPMAVNKTTGDILWTYIDAIGRPSFPFGYRNNRSVVNSSYFIFIHRSDTLVVLNTATGVVLEEVPLSSITSVDYPEEGNLFQLFDENQFLYMVSDYDIPAEGRAYILTIDEEAPPGSRVSVVEHPESGELYNGKQLFWGWYDSNWYDYWGIWNKSFYLDTEEGSYYLYYFSDESSKTGSLTKYNSSHEVEWVYDLYNIPTFTNHYMFYDFVKASGKIALLPNYGSINNGTAGMILIDDSNGEEIALPPSANEKLFEYTIDGYWVDIMYPKNPEGDKIPFIGHVEFWNTETSSGDEAVVYGYFDVSTLEWVDYRDFNFPGDWVFLEYPLDPVLGVLQKEATGEYFYPASFSEEYEGPFANFYVFGNQYLMRLSKDFDSIAYEKLDFGSDNVNSSSASIQSALTSDGRIFGINRNNQIFSSKDDREFFDWVSQDLDEGEWYDHKSGVGFRPLLERTTNTLAIPSTTGLKSSSKTVPITLNAFLNTEEGRLSRLFLAQSSALGGVRSSFPCPNDDFVVVVSGNGSAVFVNTQTGKIDNQENYPSQVNSNLRRYMFREDGTPVAVLSTSTNVTVLTHDGSSWVSGGTINVASASSYRFYIYEDNLYAFRAVNGGDVTVLFYNWLSPGWSVHATTPTPSGSTTYWDTTADFSSAVNIADKDGVLYLSNGFEYDMDTGLFTEVPYPETFYTWHRISGSKPNNRISLQVVGEYLLAFYTGIGVGYFAVRRL